MCVVCTMFVWLTLKYFKIYEVSVVTRFPFSLQKQNYIILPLHFCLLWLLSLCLYVRLVLCGMSVSNWLGHCVQIFGQE